MALKRSLDVTVFTVGGQALIGVLTDCTVESSVLDEDAASVNEIDEDPEPVARQRRITGTALVDTAAKLMQIIEGANPVVAFTFTTGANSYTGNALVSRVSHGTPRKRLPTETFELKVKGVLTVTAPA